VDVRRLVVCCDGTWQNVAQDSNVIRLHTAVVTPDGDPEPLYVKGVGVSRNPVDKLRGGLIGAGLSTGVTDGYAWLVRHHRPGDEIAVFGFSRGAYTARSLAGMIGRVGLVDGTGLDDAGIAAAVERAYTRYRDVDAAAGDTSWSSGLSLAYRPGDPDHPVRFIGVWDTVGALGIPSYIGIPDLFGSRRRYEFLDVTLNPYIPHARHAVSLDEMRGPFRPALWRGVAPGRDVKQVWFPGDHCDVGGGHIQKGLSDGALDWMMREATDAIGLEFDRSRIHGFAPNFQGVLHGLRHGLIGAVQEVGYQPRPRATPRVDHQHAVDEVDPSAYERQKAIGYRATRTLAEPGENASVVVNADRGWTSTGVWLEPGSYLFQASGTWSSAGDTCGPEGDSSRLHFSGNVFSRAIGAVERALRAVVGNPDAELAGARREPGQPWMSLVGVVANEQTHGIGAVVAPDDHIPIGARTKADVVRAGYLHAFPNDAWGFFGNNSGMVLLTVTRT
jgi:hypothetical protein